MRHKRGMVGVAFLLLAFFGISFAQAPSSSTRVVRAAAHDVSPPLRDTRWDLPPIMQLIVGNADYSREQLERLRHKLVKEGRLKAPGSHTVLPAHRKPAAMNPLARVHDSRAQRKGAAAQAESETTAVIGFDGLGYSTFDETGFFPTYARPDANAAVGLNYVVETVNSDFAVYDKSDGSLVMGPTSLGTLWTGFGTDCSGGQFTQLLHPVVLYDQLAQRWIISALVQGTSTWCVAISRTDDPTGEYYRYEFDGTLPPGSISDGVKMGVWSNAYYFAFNAFDGGSGQFAVAAFGALDRAAMLAGKDATMVIVGKTQAVYSELPADLDGFTPPPAGAPGLFMNYISPNLYGADAPYALALWAMHVDWNDPHATTLTGPTLIEVPPFNDLLCGGDSACIPEPTPGEPVESISDRLMYRLAYRNFGDHEALVVNQTVTANKDDNPPAAVRWYELDTSAPGAEDWSLKQSGTFDPTDGASRWLGSIAMDRTGDMALGYSLSGPDVSPSVAYTGRLAGDPAGTMTLPETMLAAGSGAQVNTFQQAWGGYSSMALDPDDDCTFWYTDEYYSGIANGKNWSSHISAFKFDACTPVPKGVLTGTVTDAAGGNPVKDASVTLEPGGALARTDESGNYRIELPAGDYTATSGSFGYADKAVSVTVTDGGTTTQNFSLAEAPSATLSGKVTDGSGHGYGLYARIGVTVPGIGQVVEVWTNPADGSYSVKLPKGFEYVLAVKTVLDGYRPAAATLTLSGNATENFALTVGAACTAPGYSFQLGGFGEDFNGNWPPQGWTIVNDVTGSPVIWNTNGYWQDRNITGGTGTAADVSSSKAWIFDGYNGHFDASLVTPPLAVTSLPADPVAVYKANYDHSFQDAFDLDISVDGAAWQNVLHWTKTHGTPYRGPGEKVKADIGAFIPAGASSIRLRWRYYDLAGGNDLSAQIDDVAIGACQPLPGGLIVGQVTDANTGAGITGGSVTDDKQDQAPLLAPTSQSGGLATGTYVLFAPPGDRALTVSAGEYTPGQAQVEAANNKVTAKDFALGAGMLSADPRNLDVHVVVNEQKQEALTLGNSGSADTHYTLLAINTPVPATHPQAMGPFAPTPRYSYGAYFPERFNCPQGQSDCRQSSEEKIASLREGSSAGSQQGDEIYEFPAGISFEGLVVNHDAGDLWLGSSVGNGGDGKAHRFLFDGTNTGDAIKITSVHGLYSSDMAFDGITGRFWQLTAEPPRGQSSFIYEIDPQTQVVTGERIEVPSPQRETGLAFNPVTNTWYAADFSSGTVYHFDSSGTLLDSFNFGKPINGLTYNPATGHLFVLAPFDSQAGSLHNFYVLDVKNHYALLRSFDIHPGIARWNPGVGFGHDCAGHLWVSDALNRNRIVREVESGETGWCSFKGISWLTLAPKLGTVAHGGSASVEVTFDGTGQKPFTSTQAYLKLVGNTPYPAPTIPITVHWDPQPVSLMVSGSASPTSIRKGDNLVYTLTVKNAQQDNHGTATETKLTYSLPQGVAFVSVSGGDGVSCVAPSASAGGTPGVLACDLGTLDQGAAKTVTITVRAEQAGKLTSHFEVTAREPNDSDKSTLVIATTVIGTADVSIKAENATIPMGTSGTLHLSIGNAGPDPATDVVLKLTAGANLKLQSATSDRGACTLAGTNGLSCAIGEIAAGGKVGITAAIFGIAAGSATVTAQAITSAEDPDGSNDVVMATVTVQADNGGTGGSGSDGGGGALDWLALAALLGIALAAVGRKERRRES